MYSKTNLNKCIYTTHIWFIVLIDVGIIGKRLLTFEWTMDKFICLLEDFFSRYDIGIAWGKLCVPLYSALQ